MLRHPEGRLLRHRLALSLLAGLLPLLSPLAWPSRLLLAWCVGVACYLLLAWTLALRLDARHTRARAQALDPPGWQVFAILLLAWLASVAAIAVLLFGGAGRDGPPAALHAGLAMAALAASWGLIHTVFAFRYAHLYYHGELRRGDQGPGLIFPGSEAPDYADFLYYALVVGMTSQVSDVQVACRSLRRLTLMQSLLAFAFNMFVLALGVNLLAGLVH